VFILENVLPAKDGYPWERRVL